MLGGWRQASRGQRNRYFTPCGCPVSRVGAKWIIPGDLPDRIVANAHCRKLRYEHFVYVTIRGLPHVASGRIISESIMAKEQSPAEAGIKRPAHKLYIYLVGPTLRRRASNPVVLDPGSAPRNSALS